MSFWQWLAAVNGYAAANSPKGGATLTEAEKDELWTMVDEGHTGPRELSTMTYWWDERGPVPAGIVTFQA